MKKPVVTSVILALTCGLSAGAMADDQTDSVDRATDYRGAPPFKRHGVTAQRSSQVVVANRVRSSGVAVSGKPPFKRNLETQTASDDVAFARLEETSEAPAQTRRSGPPGKLRPFSRR